MQQSFTKTVSSLTDTGMRVMLVTCLVFAGLTAMFNPWLSLGEVAALVGVAGFGEPMNIWVALGLGCILASVYILR